MHIEFKPSSDFNNVKINRAPDGAMAETLAAILTGGENLDSRSYVKCFKRSQDYGISNEINWLYFLCEGGRGCPKNSEKMCFNSIATRNGVKDEFKSVVWRRVL